MKSTRSAPAMKSAWIFPGDRNCRKKYIIGPDGRITLPIAGPLMVANLTRPAAAKAIVDALSSDYTNLTVTVNIEKYGSNRVTVLGNVQHPGVLLFRQHSNIARCGLPRRTPVHSIE